MEEDLSISLVFLADISEPQKKASEGVLFVVGVMLLDGDPLLRPCHLAELGDESAAYPNLLGCSSAFEPWEADLIVRDLDGQVVHSESLLEQPALGGDKCFQVGERGIGEQTAGHRNTKPCGGCVGGVWLTVIGCESLSVKHRDELLDLFAVYRIIDTQIAFSGDGDIADATGEVGVFM